MTLTAQTPPAEWLPRGLAALDERFAKAKAERFTVKALADRKFAVTNGEGGILEALRGQAAQHGDEVAMPHVINEILVERLAALQRVEREEAPARPGRERRRRAASSSSALAEPAQPAPVAG